MKKITIDDLAKELATKRADTISKDQVKDVIEDVLDIVTEHLKSGETIHFRSFGQLSVRERPGFNYYYIKDRTHKKIASYKAISFRPSLKLRMKIRGVSDGGN